MNHPPYEPQDLWTAIFTAAAAFPTFPATASNQQSGSRYTPLNDILVTAKPILAQNRLLLTYTTSLHSQVFTVHQHLRLIGTDEEMTSDLHFILERGNAHEIASLVTYARRYLMAITFALALGIDDDGNGANEELTLTRPTTIPLPSLPLQRQVAPRSTDSTLNFSQELIGQPTPRADRSVINPKAQEGLRLANLWVRLKSTVGTSAAQKVLIQCAGTPDIKLITPEQFPVVITAMEQRLSTGDQAA